MSLSKKEKRAYQRMVSGLTIANYKLGFMRFMTLTTARNVPTTVTVHHKDGSTSEISKLTRDFDKLKLRIQRATIEKDGFKGFRFNRYFKLTTDEGYGVFHIVYWGEYIPQAWLSSQWDEIHSSPIVYIEACYGGLKRNIKGLVGYLLTNYLTKQPIRRMSYGWKWAWLGFCKSWQNIKKNGEIRRSADNSPPQFIDNIKTDGKTVTHYWSQVWPPEKRWRKITFELWNFLMKEPLPTTRQIKFCNPDHTRYYRHFHMDFT